MMWYHRIIPEGGRCLQYPPRPSHERINGRQKWMSNLLVSTTIGGENEFRLSTYNSPSTEFMCTDPGRSANQGQGDDTDYYLRVDMFQWSNYAQ